MGEMATKQPERKEEKRENEVMKTKGIRCFKNDGVGNRFYRWRINCSFLFNEEILSHRVEV